MVVGAWKLAAMSINQKNVVLVTQPQHGYFYATIYTITLVAHIAGVALLARLTMGVSFVMSSIINREQYLHDVASDCLVARDHATEKEIQTAVAGAA